MAASYIPGKLATFSTFANNFSTLITANPALYGLTAGDAAAIAAPTATFNANYAVSTSPTTRSPTTVNATQVARNALTAIIRAYGRLILSNGGVANSDKIALGLIVRDPVPTPIPVPSTNPILGVVGAQTGVNTMTFKDSAAGPNIKAKPFGATGLELHVFFGTVAPASPAATPYYGIITRTPFALNTTGGTPGQTAYAYGRWINAKGQAGPWSPLSQHIIA